MTENWKLSEIFDPTTYTEHEMADPRALADNDNVQRFMLRDSQGAVIVEQPEIESVIRYIRELEAAQQVDSVPSKPPLLVCSETIRSAILRGDDHAIGIAIGLVSLAKEQGGER